MKLKVYKNGGIGLTHLSSAGGKVLGFITLSDTISSQDYAAQKSYADASFTNMSVDRLLTGYLPSRSFASLITGDLIAANIASVKLKARVPQGVYSVVTVNAKGLITAARPIAEEDIPSLDWSIITTGKPTTSGGYGITDALLNTGGTVTGAITLSANPETAQQACSKSYADSQLTSFAAPYIGTGDIMFKRADLGSVGYLRCNGANVLKSAYPALYTVLGDNATMRYAEGVFAGSGQPWKSQYNLNAVQADALGGWTTHTVLPVTSHQSHAVVTKGRVYLLGGRTTTNSVATIYTAPVDAAGVIGTWVSAGNLPAAIASGQVVLTKNRIYLLGGMVNATYVASVYTAPIDATGVIGAWTTVAALPAAVAQAQSLVTRTRVYLFGGRNATASVNVVYSAPIDSAGVIGTWTTDLALPGILSGSELIATKNRVYLLGGIATSVYSSAVYTAPINADGTVGPWVTAPTALPAVTAYHQAVVTKNSVYLLGGFNGSYSATSYTAPVNADGTLGTWTATTALPSTLAYSQLVCLVGKLYSIGGYVAGSYSNIVRYTDFKGIVKDYAPYYDGSLNYVDPNYFTLPDLSLADKEDHSYFVKL